jgi:sugar fermentation stimulation protein A
MVRTIYFIIIFIPRRLRLEIGLLGETDLEKGYYIYIGSGGRNIYKRIGRHFRVAKRRKWHIDYITNIYPAIEAYIVRDVDEYTLSQYFYEKGLKYIYKFGATDKKSISHLYFVSSKSELENEIISLRDRYRVKKLDCNQFLI